MTAVAPVPMSTARRAQQVPHSQFERCGGLVCVYALCFFASLKPDLPKLGGLAERVLGFFRLGTGFWLMYLVFAVALNFILKYTLPL
jgi:hypothetical protein